ncbi:peptide chain release factor N(5)-glutamine methyltransferase [Synechocystis sp. PCC 7509]|uniref:peptide chain release factor N(5)-glutamine methyltransferase n=1 Tax=Synechocystis sp. PCC 7509 TaxID=927677 RepID=UPI0002ABAEA6|nr:peptide chain release factor N(5)-glutamine methyltransferase [Synechocystis sp. PCC 7509]
MTQKLWVVSGDELWQWRKAAQKAAIAAKVLPSELDWLLQEVAGLEKLTLRLESFQDLPQIPLQLKLEDLDRLWQRRLEECLPVQYIAGVVFWRNFKLAVSPAVLIPRPETEQLIDLAVMATKSSPPLLQGHWADLGTGSGAISVGLAEVFPQAKIHAVDSSQQAIEIALTNAQSLGYGNRINFYQGSWWQPLARLKGKFSGMVSNPPYIPSALVSQLQPEVAQHEPKLALDGGEDGLDCLRYLVDTAPDYLQSGGVWLVETMAGQAEIVAKLLGDRQSYTNISIHADLAGIERFVLALIK